MNEGNSTGARSASDFQDLALLEAAIKKQQSLEAAAEMQIAIGSRAHLVGDESTVKVHCSVGQTRLAKIDDWDDSAPVCVIS